MRGIEGADIERVFAAGFPGRDSGLDASRRDSSTGLRPTGSAYRALDGAGTGGNIVPEQECGTVRIVEIAMNTGRQSVGNEEGDPVGRRRPPTDRQIELLAFMSRHHARTGAWPTHRQMARALALNTTNLTPALRLLEAKGLLKEIPDASKGNRALTDLGRRIVSTEEWRTRPM